MATAKKAPAKKAPAAAKAPATAPAKKAGAPAKKAAPAPVKKAVPSAKKTAPAPVKKKAAAPASVKKAAAPAAKKAAPAPVAKKPAAAAASKKTVTPAKKAAPSKVNAVKAKPVKAMPATPVPAKAAPVKAVAVKAAAVKTAPVKAVAVKAVAVKTVAVKAATATPAVAKPVAKAVAKKVGPLVPEKAPVRGVTKEGIAYTKDFDAKFLTAQRALLLEEKASLIGQAVRLEDEALALITEQEMGDVQFDDEGGEGDTMVVERERDLALSAQARQTVADIEAALERLIVGTYGYSIESGRAISRERLEAIPWATVLVEEKVGGIGRR